MYQSLYNKYKYLKGKLDSLEEGFKEREKLEDIVNRIEDGMWFNVSGFLTKELFLNEVFTAIAHQKDNDCLPLQQERYEKLSHLYTTLEDYHEKLNKWAEKYMKDFPLKQNNFLKEDKKYQLKQPHINNTVKWYNQIRWFQNHNKDNLRITLPNQKQLVISFKLNKKKEIPYVFPYSKEFIGDNIPWFPLSNNNLENLHNFIQVTNNKVTCELYYRENDKGFTWCYLMMKYQDDKDPMNLVDPNSSALLNDELFAIYAANLNNEQYDIKGIKSYPENPYHIEKIKHICSQKEVKRAIFFLFCGIDKTLIKKELEFKESHCDDEDGKEGGGLEF